MTEITTLTEQNRSAIENFYAAGSSGDIATMLSYLADDVIIHEPPFLPYGGKYHGKDGLVAVYQTIGQFVDISRVQLHYVVVDNDRAFAVIEVPDVRTSENIRLTEESRLADGKIVELRLYYFDVQSILNS